MPRTLICRKLNINPNTFYVNGAVEKRQPSYLETVKI